MKPVNASDSNWLITGGLGYIGAHVARKLIATGHKVTLIDNLSSGLLSRKPDASFFFKGDVQDSEFIRDICQRQRIKGVIHLASYKHARESRLEPIKYWVNNVGGTLGLVQGLQGSEVSKVIFSSSCSIYGNNSEVNESTTDNPQSPYAYTKKVSEDILTQSLVTQNISLVNLRFFNVIGCDNFPDAHDKSQECLIPVIANNLLSQAPFKIYGTDHPTKDGTCLRDYIDVRDLASAHALIASKIGKGNMRAVINVSTGSPVSVLQVLKEFESVTNTKIPFIQSPANPADPVAIWSHKSRDLTDLGWQTKHSLRESIISHWKSLSQSVD